MFSRTCSSKVTPVLFTLAAATSSLACTSTEKVSPPPDDRLKFWQDRWNLNETRWHRASVHPSLERFFPIAKQGKTNVRALVPLCGKSVDMAFLAADKDVSSVVGVEGVDIAVKEFAKENPELELKPTLKSTSLFEEWTGKGLKIFVGDFFQMNSKEAGNRFDLVWDRGSLVAIDPSLRTDYVRVIGSLMAPGGTILLSTVERPGGDRTKGPPFTLDEDDVRGLFENADWVNSVELLDAHSALRNESWLRMWYIYWFMGNAQEKVFLIKAK